MEMILETYFMHLDNTYNKLQTLCMYHLAMNFKVCVSHVRLSMCGAETIELCAGEYIDDTQDYVNTGTQPTALRSVLK